MKTTVNYCARCGGNHEKIEMKKFGRPVIISADLIFEYWITCPETGEPILVNMEYLNDDDIEE